MSELRQRKGERQDGPKNTSQSAADSAAQPAVARSSAADVKPVATKFDDGPSLLERYERWLPLLIFIVCLATRLYRIDMPKGVVFDEFHFGRFTNQYHAGTYFFDIHPPLGKLVLYFVSLASGYDASACSYANIQDPYGDKCGYVALRMVSAVAGSVPAPLLYVIVRGFGGGVYGGLLAAALFTCEVMCLCESRLILVDAQLLMWIMLALATAQAWWRAWNAHWAAVDAFDAHTHVHTAVVGTAEERAAAAVRSDVFASSLRASPAYMSLGRRAVWTMLVAATCANALSIKFTALATPGMIAVESFFALFFLRRAVPLSDLVCVLTLAALLFLSYYYVHFALLPATGDGDAFMSWEFQRSLVGNAAYDADAPRPGFLTSVWELNVEMIRANARIEQRHAWDSVWWEWPLNLRGILYYSKDAGWTHTASVYLLGNPIVLWIVALAVFVAFLLLFLYMRLRTDASIAFTRGDRRAFAALSFCLAVYWLNLLPYIAVNRSCFIYHYMPALLYGILVTAILAERLAGKRWMPVLFQAIALAAIAGFLFYSPWVYAFPLTPEGHARRRWLRRWD